MLCSLSSRIQLLSFVRRGGRIARAQNFIDRERERERMQRLKSLSGLYCSTTRAILTSQRLLRNDKEIPWLLHRCPSRFASVRFLDIYQIGNKDAIEKERARLKDEMSRGYFADMSDLKKHGGKIAMANKDIIPAAVAVKFPALVVSYSDGESVNLPVGLDGNADKPPKATLLGLSFRASSQAMIESWTRPFLDAFSNSKDINLYEVSFVDSWLLSLNPIKRVLLRMMKKSNPADGKDTLQRQFVYSFGDNYYFRKEVQILNLLTGYMFLIDKFGRIRWQGFGMATEEELASLVSCTSLLLKEK